MVISLMWSYLERSAGLHDAQIEDHALYSNLFGIFALAVYAMCIFEKKRNYYHDRMDWTRGFLSGLTLTVMIALLSPLIQYIVLEKISPEFLLNMKSYYVSRNEAGKALADAMFSFRGLLLQAIFNIMSMGVVASAIIAWFARSKEFRS